METIRVEVVNPLDTFHIQLRYQLCHKTKHNNRPTYLNESQFVAEKA